MANGKEIKGRIRSVRNIGQITKAMELVSAAKMRKAQAQARSSRTYAKLSSALLENLASRTQEQNHPLLSHAYSPEDAQGQALVLVIGPDKGLAGALNLNLIQKTLEVVKQENHRTDFVTIGKKSTDAIRRIGSKIVATFDARDREVSINDARPIAQIAINEFVNGHYTRVFIVYTDFVSTLVQKPAVLRLLPLAKVSEPDSEEYLFEPSPDDVWDNLIYRTIEFAVYQSMLEAVASEHSARMVAMRNANQSATDLVSELQLSYNQARQAAITKELSEISAAKLAMEG
ncbi:MAG TPA: ATP synthase F1 subunit gamma [Patescibacteria group bacterium]|nr:ATP synthase F1 subunit gamma [Patescibacteria group bacterium]